MFTKQIFVEFFQQLVIRKYLRVCVGPATKLTESWVFFSYGSLAWLQTGSYSRGGRRLRVLPWGWQSDAVDLGSVEVWGTSAPPENLRRFPRDGVFWVEPGLVRLFLRIQEESLGGKRVVYGWV